MQDGRIRAEKFYLGQKVRRELAGMANEVSGLGVMMNSASALRCVDVVALGFRGAGMASEEAWVLEIRCKRVAWTSSIVSVCRFGARIPDWQGDQHQSARETEAPTSFKRNLSRSRRLPTTAKKHDPAATSTVRARN